MNKNWINKGIRANKGKLHDQLDIDRDKGIQTKTLKNIVDTPVGNKVRVGDRSYKVTKLLKNRANFALNMRDR